METMMLCLIFSLMYILLSVTLVRAGHPVNVAAKLGETVTLQCSDFAANYVQWLEHVTSNSGHVISTNGLVKHSTRADRYSISRQVRGQYDLVIRQVAYDDAGRYTCSVIDSREQRSAYLVVLGGDPYCTALSDDRTVAEGDMVTYRCAVQYSGDWEPVMTWNGPNGHTLATSFETTPSPSGQGENIVTYTLRMPARVSADGASVTYFCRTYFALPGPNTSTTVVDDNVNISYAEAPPTYQFAIVTPVMDILYPVRNLRILHPKDVYMTGDVVSLMADGFPSPSIAWINPVVNRTMHVGNNLPLEPGNTGVLSYRCVATNVVRRHKYNETLLVKVVVVEHNEDVSANGVNRSEIRGNVVIEITKEANIETIVHMHPTYLVGAVFACVVTVLLAPVIACVICTDRQDTPTDNLKAEIRRLRNLEAGQRHKSRRLHFPLHYYKRRLDGSKWHDVHEKLLYYQNHQLQLQYDELRPEPLMKRRPSTPSLDLVDTSTTNLLLDRDHGDSA